MKGYKKIMWFLTLLIFISFFNFVFSANNKINGLKTLEGNDVYCDYTLQTNNCVLGSGDYILNSTKISVSQLHPNLVINSNVKISYFQDPLNPNQEISSLIIEDFNSIVVNSNSLTFDLSLKNYIFKTDLIINYNASVFLKNNYLFYKCIEVTDDDLTTEDPLNEEEEADADISDDEIEDDIDFTTMVLKPIDLSKLNIYNNGNFVFQQIITVSAASTTTNSYSCSENNNLGITLTSQDIVFGKVDNNGIMDINVGINKATTSIEDIDFETISCKIHFNDFSKNLPKSIIFNSNKANTFSQVFLTTCEVLTIPQSKTYQNICALIYTRPEDSTVLTPSNTGIQKIINLTKNCNMVEDFSAIASYFLTDENQTVYPLVFGNIKKIEDDTPITPVFSYTAPQYGLFETSNLSDKLSDLNYTPNNGFFIFSLNSEQKNLELIKTYLFKFKLEQNSQLGNPDLDLIYPFKIYR